MTPSRNLLVGLFVLIALALLSWMIVRFGAAPRAFANTYALTMQFPSAGTLAEGSEVRCAGVLVGHVRTIKPARKFLQGVSITADIDANYTIPADAVAVINTGGLTLSKMSIELMVPPGARPAMLPRDGTAKLVGEVRTGFEGLIPTDVRQSLVLLADDLHVLFRPQSLAATDAVATTGPDGRLIAATQPVGNISTVVQRMDQTLRRMNELLDARHGDVSMLLANMRQASEDAKTVTASLKTFADRAVVVANNADQTFQTATTQLKRVGDALVDNSVKLSASLDNLNKSLAAVADGKGTAGRFIHDPALYENMLLAADRLHKTIIELQELAKQWQAEGVRIKLK